MKVLLFVAVCLLVHLPLSNAELLPEGSDLHKYQFYIGQIQIFQKLLADECPHLAKAKRQIDSNSFYAYQVEGARRAYNELISKLIECRKSSSSSFINYTATAPLTASMPAATTAQPKECLSAKNLTEPWRRDIGSAHIKPVGNVTDDDWGCDLTSSLKWFRFTGPAGEWIYNCYLSYFM